MEITREYIDEAIKQAEAGMPADLPVVEGFSSDRVRRLLNWLCQLEGANYLEIGTHKGSTLIPALWGNRALASCIDIWTAHWALGNAQRADLEANLVEYLPGREVNVVEEDMFTVDLGLLVPEVNVYFFDGPHSREGQYQAFVHYNLIFAPRFIALVDDWNCIEAREETMRAFDDLHYEVEAQWVLPATPCRDTERWWNGLFVAIVNKRCS